jgi:hypothetical protein
MVAGHINGGVFLLKIFLVANPSISHRKSHKQCIISKYSQQHCYVSPKKPYALTGFEPSSLSPIN